MRKLKITEMNRLTVDEFKQAEKMPLVVVLDDVRSLHNVGAVFRTSDAFRVERILLCGITAVPPQPEIHKTALGAEDSVDWTYYKDTVDAVRALQVDGYKVYAVEQAEGSTMLQDFRWEAGQRCAVVMGNEVKGCVRMSLTSVTVAWKSPNMGRNIRSMSPSRRGLSSGNCLKSNLSKFNPSPSKPPPKGRLSAFISLPSGEVWRGSVLVYNCPLSTMSMTRSVSASLSSGSYSFFRLAPNKEANVW